jgi:molybdopterin-guanine dinucleotide biosynthesis protein A
MKGTHDDSVAIVLLAGGRGSRFGGLKQRAPVGPAGEPLAAYTLHDAAGAGIGRAVVVCPAGMGQRLRRELADFAPPTLPLQGVEQENSPPRARPWGTAHALLAAADALGATPFVVANADDFYGRSAIASAAAALRDSPVTRHAVVAYRLDRTMSETDGVSRARCRVEGNRLVRVEERFDVRHGPDGRFRARAPDGTKGALEPETLVSMNLWAFRASILADLRRGWSSFLDAGPSDAEEFMIPDAVNRAIRGGADVRVVRTDAKAFGITARSDLDRARASIARLVARGAYPADLRDGARRAAAP